MYLLPELIEIKPFDPAFDFGIDRELPVFPGGDQADGADGPLQRAFADFFGAHPHVLEGHRINPDGICSRVLRRYRHQIAAHGILARRLADIGGVRRRTPLGDSGRRAVFVRFDRSQGHAADRTEAGGIADDKGVHAAGVQDFGRRLLMVMDRELMLMSTGPQQVAAPEGQQQPDDDHYPLNAGFRLHHSS